jgi:RimJ/RimL family protein N-acetyltransferase
VADLADDRCVGSVDVFGLERHGAEAEIGYWTHPAERGRGVIGEAVGLAVRHAVIPVADGGLGQRRLSLRHGAGNAASRRVAVRAGFREVGVERAVDPAPDGGYDDLVRYDLLASEVSSP